MKLFKSFTMLLLAGLTFAACSESNDVANNTPLTDESTGNYLAFQLYLPTTSGSATRANDVFDDGIDNAEYKVDEHNAYLVLFQNSTDNEEDATFCGAYQLNVNTFNTVGITNDQCTTEGVVSTAVDGTLITSDYLYGYVILNANSMVSNATSSSITVSDAGSSKTFGTGSDYSDKKFSTFKSIKFSVINDGGSTPGKFLMTNAPVSASAGGTAKSEGAVTLLAKLNKTLYKSQALAEANPAGEVYVERAAVKVTVAKSTSPSFADKLKNATDVAVDIVSWALGNTNTYYYNNRHVTQSWGSLFADGTEGTVSSDRKYRFVSKDPIHTGIYRTYWAEDVNYTTADASSEFSVKAPDASKVTTSLSTSSAYVPLYTTENTFDVERMIQKNTTLAVIKAKIGNGDDFYTATERDRDLIYKTGSDEKAKVQGLIDTELKKFDTKYNTWATTAGNALKVENVTFTNGVLSNITFGSNTADKPGDSNYEKATGDADFKAYIIRVLGINKYEGGMAYYNIRIRHFADDETPWKATGRNTNDIAHIYGYESSGSWALDTSKSPANFLGRYGVVRNNWYQIEIDGVRSIGEPVPPTPGDTPDDEVENYISLKIHVLPWAIRAQHHTL